MIDIRYLRSEPDTVRGLMARRNKPELLGLLDEALGFDSRMRDITAERDAIRQQVNELSKQVGTLRRNGDDKAAEGLQAESRSLGDKEQTLAAETDEVTSKLKDVLLRLPNIPHADVVVGTDDSQNPTITGPMNLPASFPEHQRVSAP